MGLRLTPAGRLRWEPSGDEAAPPGPLSLQGAFETDWREALFTLAAEKTPTRDMPSVRYWQQLAEHHLTGLCHVPEDAERFEVEPLSSADCARWILTAPPMPGGEYLGEETLQRIWEDLDGWVREAVTRTGGLAAFLHERAPKWRQVGRVCFHLAENRNDEARPFAFMATYASGLGAAGRVKHLPLRKALEQYAGARNRAALVKLLSPVQQAAESCGWVRELVDSGDVYRPMAWTAAQAWRLLRSAEDLEESGLSVSLPNWWRRRPRPRVSVTIGAGAPSRLDVGAMLDFDVRVALGDATLSREELDSLLDGDDGLVLLKGQWVEVDRDRLRQAVEHWNTLQRQAEGGEVSFVEGMRLLAGASADLRHEERTDDERHWVHVEPGDAMREILAGLRRPGALDAAEIADTLQAGREGRPGRHHLGAHLPRRLAHRRVRRLQGLRLRTRERLPGHLRLHPAEDHLDEPVQRADGEPVRDAVARRSHRFPAVDAGIGVRAHSPLARISASTAQTRSGRTNSGLTSISTNPPPS